MLALSFRTKLILAMSVVVAGVTGATMLVTQRRVQATYQRLFEEQFKTQINYFSEKQFLRLEAVTRKCQEIARSVRLVVALEEGDPKLVYDNVFTELRDLAKLPRPGETGTNAATPLIHLRRQLDTAIAVTTRPTELPFVRVVDPRGEPLPTSDLRAGFLGKAGKLHGRAIREFINQAGGGNLQEQEIGYLALDSDDGRVQLREFVVTPIVQQVTRQALGALVLGFPLADFGERALHDFSKAGVLGEIRSGIWLENTIHSQTLPDAARSNLAARITQQLQAAQPKRNDFEMNVDGRPHRVFYKALNPDSPFAPAYHVCLYSLAAARAEQRDLRLKIGGFGVIALVGALGLILLISHGLTVPIRQLVRGTGEIRRGNFAVKVPVRTRDEIGQLAASFNEMADGLALNRKYQSVLAQVADKEVAEQLMRGDVALGGELREVSVLFCDIRGFTALTQNMPPAEVIALLNEHMTSLTAVVYEQQGVVDKFVGDLIMAVFGAPKSYGRDVFAAARCALRMVEERQKLNQTSRHRIDVGIGLATGQAVAGCMGSADRLNYTVLGERVNRASRLCGIAGCMEVLIDETTRERLGEAAKVELLPDVLLKGFSDLVRAYRLMEIRPLPGAG